MNKITNSRVIDEVMEGEFEEDIKEELLVESLRELGRTVDLSKTKQIKVDFEIIPVEGFQEDIHADLHRKERELRCAVLYRDVEPDKGATDKEKVENCLKILFEPTNVVKVGDRVRYVRCNCPPLISDGFRIESFKKLVPSNLVEYSINVAKCEKCGYVYWNWGEESYV